MACHKGMQKRERKKRKGNRWGRPVGEGRRWPPGAGVHPGTFTSRWEGAINTPPTSLPPSQPSYTMVAVFSHCLQSLVSLVVLYKL